MYALGLGSPSLTHLYPPPVAGNAEPSSAYVKAVNTVITPLSMNAIISAGPASAIPGPTRTKIAPPIIDAIPIMIESFSDRLRTNPELDFPISMSDPTEICLDNNL